MGQFRAAVGIQQCPQGTRLLHVPVISVLTQEEAAGEAVSANRPSPGIGQNLSLVCRSGFRLATDARGHSSKEFLKTYRQFLSHGEG